MIHIFAECSASKKAWKKRIHYFRNTLDLPEISPQRALFGFLLADKETFQIKNLIFLLFKIYLYESRSSKALSSNSFLTKIKKSCALEKNCSINNETKEKTFKEKSIKIAHLI